jgi:hypothetical protein
MSKTRSDTSYSESASYRVFSDLLRPLASIAFEGLKFKAFRRKGNQGWSRPGCDDDVESAMLQMIDFTLVIPLPPFFFGG